MPENSNFSLTPFFGINSLEEAGRLAEYINSPLFTTKDLGISRKNINYWDREGLLLSSRSKGETWRSYTFVDYVWLNIVDELRYLGCPIQVIKDLKSVLVNPIPIVEVYKLMQQHPELYKNLKNMEGIEEFESFIKLADFSNTEIVKELDKIPYDLLRILIGDALGFRVHIALAVFSDGYCIPIYTNAKLAYKESDLNDLTYGSYARISLSAIIWEFISDEKLQEYMPKLNLLQPGEEKLLEIIHTGDYDTITIHFKNKKMESLELKKKQDVKKKIVDILKDNEYQDIVIKRHKGMITTIENTVKVYMDDKQKIKESKK